MGEITSRSIGLRFRDRSRLHPTQEWLDMGFTRKALPRTVELSLRLLRTLLYLNGTSFVRVYFVPTNLTH
jgi:hypothetical protein